MRAKNRRREHFHNFIKMIEEITALKKTEIERKRERERERGSVSAPIRKLLYLPYRGVDSKNMRRRTVKKKNSFTFYETMPIKLNWSESLTLVNYKNYPMFIGFF